MLLENGNVTAMTSKSSSCCSKPVVAAEGAGKSTQFLTRQWAAPEGVVSKSTTVPDSKKACCEPSQSPSLDEFLQRIKTHTFAVSGMAFQDVWNVDLERTRNCCIHVVTPEAKAGAVLFVQFDLGGWANSSSWT